MLLRAGGEGWAVMCEMREGGVRCVRGLRWERGEGEG